MKVSIKVLVSTRGWEGVGEGKDTHIHPLTRAPTHTFTNSHSCCPGRGLQRREEGQVLRQRTTMAHETSLQQLLGQRARIASTLRPRCIPSPPTAPSDLVAAVDQGVLHDTALARLRGQLDVMSVQVCVCVCVCVCHSAKCVCVCVYIPRGYSRNA